jgi:2-(1,2-epoxy-1,2-dihydrophenyl)acetyl-CoA isomerase
MDYQYITHTSEQGVATVTLNRPDVLNSCNRPMVAELCDALARAAADAACARCCSPAPAARSARGRTSPRSRRRTGRRAPDIGDVVEGLQRARPRHPVHREAGGLRGERRRRRRGRQHRARLRHRARVEAATFVQAFAKIGLVPGQRRTFFLPRLVGVARATSMMMLGEKVTAAQALEWG